MSFNHLGYVKGSPLDLVSKKIAELKKTVVTYEALFDKLENNLNLNLSDLLELRKLGSNVNKGIKTLKEECIDDAKRNGHVIEDKGLYCINCKLNVCEATDGECSNNMLRASAESIQDLQPKHTSLPFPFPISGSLPPNTTILARTGLSGYTAPNVLAKLAASKGTTKGGRRTHRKRRTHRTKKHTLRKHH